MHGTVLSLRQIVIYTFPVSTASVWNGRSLHLSLALPFSSPRGDVMTQTEIALIGESRIHRGFKQQGRGGDDVAIPIDNEDDFSFLAPLG